VKEGGVSSDRSLENGAIDKILEILMLDDSDKCLIPSNSGSK
jgi:hypothetical protein